jgi:D-inositol-3-phosphate glycosyltransferase
VGGIKFTVRDGETGYLVAPDDADAVAERIAHLHRHPRLMNVFRQQAIRRANDLFTWRHVAGGVAALYEDVVAAGDPRRRMQAGHLAVVDRGFDAAVETLRESRRRLRAPIVEAAELIAAGFAEDRKVLVCGNGGSAAEAQHLVAELVGRFSATGRAALPAIALTADSAILTAWANDVGFEDVFARQVEALGRPGDVLIGISTSGRSANVVRALETARRLGLRTIGLLGRDGGVAQRLADVAITVPSSDTQKIQEVHLVAIHLVCELVEARVVGARGPESAVELARTLWDSPDRVALRSRARAA